MGSGSVPRKEEEADSLVTSLREEREAERPEARWSRGGVVVGDEGLLACALCF